MLNNDGRHSHLEEFVAFPPVNLGIKAEVRVHRVHYNGLRYCTLSAHSKLDFD